MGSNLSSISKRKRIAAIVPCTDTVSSAKCDPEKINPATLTAIRLIISNQRFLEEFLKIIEKNCKGEIFRFYEELETLRKITPGSSSKTITVNYKFQKLIATSTLLHEFFQNPYVTPSFETKSGKKPMRSSLTGSHLIVIDALQPMLNYSEQTISIGVLHEIVTDCQNALLKHFVPDFDEYVSSRYFKSNTSATAKLVRRLSSKRLEDVILDECDASDEELVALSAKEMNINVISSLPSNAALVMWEEVVTEKDLPTPATSVGDEVRQDFEDDKLLI